jgi:hypothetical protein
MRHDATAGPKPGPTAEPVRVEPPLAAGPKQAVLEREYGLLERSGVSAA